jgi:glycyl-tRNA synthetase
MTRSGTRAFATRLLRPSPPVAPFINDARVGRAVDTTDAVMDLAKRRGLLWPSFEVYGGAAGFYDYGPLGAAMKKRFEDLWRHFFLNRCAVPMAEVSCPTVTIEEVLRASGHVDEFSDLVVRCGACHTPSRADHLVAAAGFEGTADALAPDDIDREIAARKPKCPSCGKTKWSNATAQNLMFRTEIGPGSGRTGYLRPETAQGIFTDFPHLLRHFRGKLPFGAVQLGRANRNEISPRQGMIRLREFSMMEAEVFFAATDVPIDAFRDVADRAAVFVPNTTRTPVETTFGAAVHDGLVANEPLAYFLALTHEFLTTAGMDAKRLRFRQHLVDEMAHYARDCWDAEFLSERYGWVECVGVADRGCYDLTQHAKHSGRDNDFRVAVPLAAPIAVPVPRRQPDLGALGKALKQQAKAVAVAMEREFRDAALAAYRDATDDEDDDVAFTYSNQDGTAPTGDARQGDATTVRVHDGGSVANVQVPAGSYHERDGLWITEVRRIPRVIEPSFGVDRILFALWEHAYERGEKNGEPYTVLHLSPHVAPVQVAVLPLTSDDALVRAAAGIESGLRRAGILTLFDTSGNIGRRYARQDEAGTPFCITIDADTLTDEKVTLRDRDTTEQERLPVAELESALARRYALPRRTAASP